MAAKISAGLKSSEKFQLSLHSLSRRAKISQKLKGASSHQNGSHRLSEAQRKRSPDSYNMSGLRLGNTMRWTDERRKQNSHEGNPNSRLTDDQVRQIRELYATGQHTQTELASCFGVTQSMISKIVLRQNWKPEDY